MKHTFRTHIIAPGHQSSRMGEEGGRKPSLDNPEYFLFPEEAPAAIDRNPGNPASATMDKNPGEPPVMNRFFGQPATMDRLRGETATMDRRARTVSQVINAKLDNGQIIWKSVLRGE